MAFQNKELWMPKVAGHVTDGNPAFSNPSRIESKRSHHWFVDSDEPELFPSKKQAVHAPSDLPVSGASHSHVPEWESTTIFQQVPPQFIDRFESTAGRPLSFVERVIPPVGADASNMRRKVIDEQFGNDTSVGLSISHSIEDVETCYSGIRKIKVNQVKDSPSGIHVDKIGTFHGANLFNVSTVFPYNRQNEMGFMSTEHKVVDNVALVGQVYGEHAQIRSVNSTYCKGDENVMTIADTYGKEDSSIISFGGFSDERNVIPSNREVVGNFEKSCHQPSPQMTEANAEKQPSAASINTTQLTKSVPESPPKNKAETKPSRKEAPNSFPSNVRSLMSTGILDGVPVKYVAVSREELRGIIKGSGYLCGCQSCNYSKALNAYEFERHSGCKTKHPNNHIYFENGKSIYQIVQELRSTPIGMLFDTIQTAFGAPINQKSFRIWKESFQAATRELQRIYGKEGLDL